jgi:hypothetical protein
MERNDRRERIRGRNELKKKEAKARRVTESTVEISVKERKRRVEEGRKEEI